MPIRLAASELRRLTAGRLPRVALVALVLVPSLYAGLYLYANKDPYGGLERVPAAVVVEDAGTTLASGERLQVGDRVARELVGSRSFGWHRVSRDDANAGVADGTYNFALIVPRDFSAALASSADFTPRQALLEVETNDANNYLSRTIANQLVAQVTKSVASEVSSTAANQLLLGFSTIHDQVGKAADGAHQLADGLATARSGAGRLGDGAHQLAAGQEELVAGTDQLASGAAKAATGADQLAAGAAQLNDGLEELDSRTKDLPAQSAALADGARQVADGNEEVADQGRAVAKASESFLGAVTSRQGELADRLRAAGFTDEQVNRVVAEADRVSGRLTSANQRVQDASADLDRLATGSKQVAGGAARLAEAAGPLQSGIHQAAQGSGRLDEGARELAAGNRRLGEGATQLATGQREALDGSRRLASGADELDTGLAKLAKGAEELRDGLRDGLRSIPDPSEEARTAVAQTLGNPVGVKGLSLASAASYGAGLAPFFLSLALWIGAYVLFLLVRPLSDRAIAAGQPSWRTALAGWVAPAVLGVVQALVVATVVLATVGLPAEHPGLLLAFLLAVSMTFVMVLHALASRLGAPGKFLGLVLMVVQLVSAGGTFPWQTLPEPLHPLHHVLPMSYAVDGIRRLMYGGSLEHLGVDLAVLGAWFAAAFAVSVLAARRAGTWSPLRIKPELAL